LKIAIVFVKGRVGQPAGSGVWSHTAGECQYPVPKLKPSACACAAAIARFPGQRRDPKIPRRWWQRHIINVPSHVVSAAEKLHKKSNCI